MKTAEFDFYLPPGLIAERPAEKRDSSRLLVLREDGTTEHRTFSDLVSYFAPGDMLILNNSRVFPARMTGQKPTGGKVEFLLVSKLSGSSWTVLSRDGYSGVLNVAGKTVAMTEGKTVTFDSGEDMRDFIWQHGRMPLPPYIRREPDESDKARYQTVFATEEGSIAAPTAGLHFTDELLEALRSRSVLIRTVTLHVGTGTFRPVKAEDLLDHRMDNEIFEISASLPEEISAVKRRGSRIVAVGTTATRAIEGLLSGRSSVTACNGTVRGSTDIFIHEGHRFMAIDTLITNFHLPRSTPLMLAAALAGREKLLNAYKEAISSGYRFFSYGDAMLVL